MICFGDGPLRDELERQAAIPGQHPLARIMNYRADASSWLGATDFFILPSRWEGQPHVVLEALCAGLSVVSNCPVGVQDLVFDGRNGRQTSSVDELAAVIIDWSTRPEKRNLDHELTAAVLAQHDLTEVATHYETLYRDA